MHNTLKTVLTVLVVATCGFIWLISFGVYLIETDYMEYDVERMVSPVLKEAQAEYLGDSYNGEKEEGYSYYRVSITIENNSNFGIDEASMNIHFETGDGSARYLRECEESSPFDTWKEGRYYPADREAKLYKIVRVEDGCNIIDAVYKNYETDAEQRVSITLNHS